MNILPRIVPCKVAGRPILLASIVLVSSSSGREVSPEFSRTGVAVVTYEKGSVASTQAEPAPGYAAWFKADAMTGLGDGDSVSMWDDSSPNNKDATQSSASLRPVYKTAVLNGKPALRFDGANDRLVSPGQFGIWGLTNHFTVFAVVRLDSLPSAGGQDVVGSSAISNTLDLIARRNDTNGNWLAYSSSPDGTHNSDMVLSPGTWYVLTWRLHANAPKHLQIRADRVYRLNDTSYTGIGTAASQAAIGARQNGVNPFKGDIAEVIFYTNSLSDADMTATEDYLFEKYGLGGPLAPTELVATTVNYHRIDLTWVDNATNEEGYRIERHEGQADSLFTQVPSNTEAYADSTPSLLPNRQYCYRVVATNQQGESYSNEACATTDPLPSVACTTDPHDNRNKLTELLLSTDARSVGWRANVGLSGADPRALTLVENDVVCDTLWRTIRTALPSDPYSHAFFKLGDLYIVTYYPFTFNVTGPRLTAVLTEQFDIVNPVLAH